MEIADKLFFQVGVDVLDLLEDLGLLVEDVHREMELKLLGLLLVLDELNVLEVLGFDEVVAL